MSNFENYDIIDIFERSEKYLLSSQHEWSIISDSEIKYADADRSIFDREFHIEGF